MIRDQSNRLLTQPSRIGSHASASLLCWRACSCALSLAAKAIEQGNDHGPTSSLKPAQRAQYVGLPVSFGSCCTMIGFLR